jgi:hypothetical protein
MNGARIYHILLTDSHAGDQFKGIGYPDVPIVVNKKPTLYFLNTDLSVNPGEHWCAAYFYENVCEFFDPYGFAPETYSLDSIIDPHCSKRYHNVKRVQGFDKSTCGHHCLFFSLHRCRGIPFYDIMTKYYSDDIAINDRLVFSFLQKFGVVMSRIQNV